MLKILAAASEIFPLVKTGGLADVVGALPAALRPHGVAVKTLVPGYPAILAALENRTVVHKFAEMFGGPATLLAGEAKGLDLLVLDAPHLYGRPGNPYLGPDGKDWPDNAQRFAAFARAAAEICRGAVPAFVPDILHAHDWQAALAPAYLKFGPACAVKSVVTIHNLAFQGRFPAAMFKSLGLPAAAYAIDGVEYYGGVGYLKAGLQYADAITTVSPSYAREICTKENGMGLDGLLRVRQNVLSGIVNGIDIDCLGSCHRQPYPIELRRQTPGPARGQQAGGGAAIWLRGEPRSHLLHHQPFDRAEGHGSGGADDRQAGRFRCAPGSAGFRRWEDGGVLHRRGEAPSRACRGCHRL